MRHRRVGRAGRVDGPRHPSGGLSEPALPRAGDSDLSLREGDVSTDSKR
jgi:hypothetical protein